MQIILGSKSKRRENILNFFSLPFIVEASNFDESKVFFKGNIIEYVISISEKKNKCLSNRFPNDVIITADTIVAHEGKIILKPKNRNESKQTLQTLSGKKHKVISAVTVSKEKEIHSSFETSLVTFNKLTNLQIEKYLQSSHGIDKAGSYGIQEVGSLLINRIEGSFYNVMGLPVNTLNCLLKKIGIDLWNAL